MSGHIGFRKVPTLLDGGGVWSLNGMVQFEKERIWPVTNDPYFSSVVLLVPMTGANDSTVFTDVSPSPKTITPYGNAKISTAQSKWDTGSCALDGSGDYLQLDDSADFSLGTNDFTIEIWARFNTLSPTAQSIITQRFGSGTDHAFSLFINSAGNIIFAFTTNGTSMVTAIDSAHGMSINTWYHMAAARNGANLRVFVNGVQKGGTYNIGASSIHNSSATLKIGALNTTPGNYVNGYLQDARITNGVARYTGAFTPPGRPFPQY